MMSSSATSQSADTLETFRFLEVSREVRNMIYKEALTLDRNNNRNANTTLLRVCKEVHQEAKPMLEALNDSVTSILACFNSFVAGRGRVFCNVSMTGDTDFYTCDSTNLTTFTKIWPENMLGAKRNTLNIHLDDDKTIGYKHESDFYGVNHLLSGLNTFLRHPKRRLHQELKINFLSARSSSARLRLHLLHPISKLPSDIRLELRGLPSQDERKLMRWQKGLSPGRNTPYLKRDVTAEWLSIRPRMLDYSLVASESSQHNPDALTIAVTSAQLVKDFRVLDRRLGGLTNPMVIAIPRNDIDMFNVLNDVRQVFGE